MLAGRLDIFFHVLPRRVARTRGRSVSLTGGSVCTRRRVGAEQHFEGHGSCGNPTEIDGNPTKNDGSARDPTIVKLFWSFVSENFSS